MGNAAIQDDGCADAAGYGVQAGLDFGNHAAGDGAVFDHFLRLAQGNFGQQGFVFVQNPHHIGQQQQARGLHGLSNGTGGGVGVDVIGLAGWVHPNRGNDGDDVGFGQNVQNVGVHKGRLPHKAQIQ